MPVYDGSFLKGLRGSVFWTGLIMGIENLLVLLFLINMGKANIVAFIAVPVIMYTVGVPSFPTMLIHYTESLSQNQKIRAIGCVIAGSIAGLATLACAFYLNMFAFETVTLPGPFGIGSETDTMVSVNSASVSELVVLMSVIPAVLILSVGLHYWATNTRVRITTTSQPKYKPNVGWRKRLPKHKRLQNTTQPKSSQRARQRSANYQTQIRGVSSSGTVASYSVLPSGEKRCLNCGFVNSRNAKHCRNCDAKL
jgi:hypothetical protein